MRWLLVGLAIVLSACGPSAKQVEAARTARYRGPAIEVFDLAEDVARGTYKLMESDPDQYAFLTLPKWYGPDGQSESAGVGDAVIVQDGSYLVALLVQIVPEDDDRVSITVTPVVERFRMGQPTHDKVPPGDPSMPGWITGKAEALLVAIHERAKARVAL